MIQIGLPAKRSRFLTLIEGGLIFPLSIQMVPIYFVALKLQLFDWDLLALNLIGKLRLF